MRRDDPWDGVLELELPISARADEYMSSKDKESFANKPGDGWLLGKGGPGERVES